MSEVKVNKITPTTNCGTVTLGDSGDTVAIPCGVTLSNSGSITNSGTITNTGTISGGTITGNIDGQVSWDTTAKTAGFTAVAGNGYFVNTTSGAITVTLPATPSAGDLVGIKDYANTADTNNITIARNGSNIQGTANDFIISTEGLSIILIYVDATQGWVSTGSAQADNISYPIYMTATGGTVTEDGDYKIHTFTGPGTFTVCSVGNCAAGPLGNTVDYLVVAGGGGAGYFYGGGGGAGGYREGYNPGSYTASPLATTSLPISATGYPITVGGGGTGGSGPLPAASAGSNGANSVFSTITSAGGGYGGGGGIPGFGCTTWNANPGGSGGGVGYGPGTRSGGTGNTPPVSPPQGNDGGSSPPPGTQIGAGGGAGGAGAGGAYAMTGGIGAGTEINPSCTVGTPGPVCGTRYFAGGGASSGGCGGIGGGGPANTPGTINTGGGGGGDSGAGGSGIVIIRYKFQ